MRTAEHDSAFAGRDSATGHHMGESCRVDKHCTVPLYEDPKCPDQRQKGEWWLSGAAGVGGSGEVFNGETVS